MNISRYWLMCLLCTIFLIYIFIRRISTKAPTPCSSVPQTCLNSNNTRMIRKNIFHPTMVHMNPPTLLSHWVRNKTGFEIGGPSIHRWGNLNVYDAAAKVDIANFASNTLWESGLTEGSPFVWQNQTKGKHYIRDAVDLKGVPDEFYDFVLASHVLEHIANPFRALLECLRIMRPYGLLLVIMPYKNVTFDHKRDVARLEHLIDDYHKQISEADLSHLSEILRLHDLPRDPPAGSLETFKARSEKNFENRGLHQHVYDEELLYYIFVCLNLEVKIQSTWGDNTLIIGQKRCVNP